MVAAGEVGKDKAAGGGGIVILGLTKCPVNGFVGSLFPDGISVF
jgi:hypothetical protein